ALGAGRLDAIARFVSEGLIVAVTDAVIGSLGAYVAIAALRRSSTFPIPRLGEIDLDGTVLLATIGITLLVALSTSALPILRFGRRDLSPILRSGGRSATAGNDRRRVQGALVTTQVALAFVLLAASTLMARSFLELRQVQPGFDVDRVEAFRLSLPTATYVGDTVITQLYERLNAQLSAIPGVERVGIASWLPLENEGSSLSTAFREGAPPAEQEAPPVAPQVLASATYFKAVGIPFVVGRTFREIPNGSRSDEVVVSRAFAQQSLGGGELSSAIGKRLKFLPQGPWMTIVGVVGDSHLEGLERPPSAAVYLPLSSQAYGNLPSLPMDFGVVVRTQGEPSSLASVIRREVASVDPQLPIYNLRPMRDVLRVSMARTSMTALMLLVSAAVAMALGAIGLYGVVSYTVGMRTREIGLRLALGEQPQSIMRRFAREGAVLAIVGVAVGLGGALLVSRVLRGLLYGIGPNDPMVLGGAALVLVATALLASWVPARRASQLDPASVLASD
ncbi:MAG: FtsX-like permease family protein, partial [Gemmatimonadaceae bacterium]